MDYSQTEDVQTAEVRVHGIIDTIDYVASSRYQGTSSRL
jgi:hypothetical protein